MNLDDIKKQKAKEYGFKDYKVVQQALEHLPNLEDIEFDLGDTISIDSKKITQEDKQHIFKTAELLKPWRKGPFQIFDTFINTEWQSFMKYNLLEPHFAKHITNKRVVDIGCNNGYYLFKMMSLKPAKLVGFDPYTIFKMQFEFINHFLKTDIIYEPLGVEHIPYYDEKFDTIFCLGVLYHRNEPVKMLKDLKKGLKKKGVIFLDTFIIEGEEQMALCPTTYMKIPNISFVPTLNALKNWLQKAKLENFEVLYIADQSPIEQRETKWIKGESLVDFLDPKDKTKTIEGYPAPKRVFLKITI